MRRDLIGRRNRNRIDDLDLLLSHVFRRVQARRLHRDKREHLEKMRLNHVADRARLIVERGALSNRNRLCRRDLHVVDVLLIPNRLEDRVREAQDKHRLHEFLAEIVIDAIDRLFFKCTAEAAIQTRGTHGIVAEWLLDNDPLPTLRGGID